MIKKTKFYIGPMSKNIVDSIINYCEKENYNIGLISSRRQVDYDEGYVNSWITKTFIEYVRNKTDKILLCRDHGGISQGKNYDNGTLSFYNDVNFDIIHVDPWKKYTKLNDVVNETVDNIKFINTISDKCKFEVGTEEAIYPYSPDEFNMFLNMLQDRLGILYEKVVYGVIQSGTKIIGTKNIGDFNIEKCEIMSDICHKNGILSKEHNGDYLTNQDIKIRFDLGLNAINIAPEFGVIESKVLLKNMNNNQIDKIYELCYKSMKWVKWFHKNFNPIKNKIKLIEASCHYIFNDDNFKNIKYQIPKIDDIINETLLQKIKEIKEI